MTRHAKQRPSWWRRARRAQDGKIRLLCVPYAGAGASAFARWNDHLGPELELWMAILPGRDERIGEIPLTHMADLIHGLAGAAGELGDRPLAVFGHSFGALVSFELVRELRRRGAGAPLHLFASGITAPQLLVPRRPQTDAEILHEVRAMGATSDEILADPELMALVMPALRADFHLVECYAYRDEAPLDVPITAFAGRDDPSVSEAALAAWGAQTRRAFTHRRWPGGHLYPPESWREVVTTVTGVLRTHSDQ